MTTGRTASRQRRNKRGAKLPRRSRKAQAQLGEKLARHVVAVAGGRIIAAPLDPIALVEIEPVSSASERANETRAMQSDTVRDLLKRRWQSERPYQGMSTQAITRKLLANVLTDRARDHAMRELARRGEKFQPA